MVECGPFAIFPFAVRSASDDLDYLREGVVELLSMAIDGAADLRTVDPSAVRSSAISASAFRVARVLPLLGRHLVQADELEGVPRSEGHTPRRGSRGGYRAFTVSV